MIEELRKLSASNGWNRNYPPPKAQTEYNQKHDPTNHPYSPTIQAYTIATSAGTAASLAVALSTDLAAVDQIIAQQHLSDRDQPGSAGGECVDATRGGCAQATGAGGVCIIGGVKASPAPNHFPP